MNKKIIQYIHIKPESSFESIDKQLKHLRIEGEKWDRVAFYSTHKQFGSERFPQKPKLYFSIAIQTTNELVTIES